MNLQVQDIVTLLAAMLCAFLITFTTTPIARVLAFRLGAVDVPKDKRRMHKEPIPRMGGLAIFVGFVVASLVFCDITVPFAGMLAGAALLIVIGIFDDVLSLNAFVKLALQIVAASIAACSGNVINHITPFGHYIDFGKLAIPITVFWIVFLINATNLIDGLDGLSCGVSAISACSLLLSSFFVDEATLSVIIMTGVLAGSCIGFLPFNFNPAKIFMGDTGSMFLGYTLAVISIQGFFKFNALVSFAVPFVVFAVPLFDTAFAFIRRMAHGKSPFSADRGHIHHRLIDMGFNQKQSVMILYAICAILGISSILLANDRVFGALAIICVAMITFVLNWFFVNKSPQTRNHLGLGLSCDGMPCRATCDGISCEGSSYKEDPRSLKDAEKKKEKKHKKDKKEKEEKKKDKKHDKKDEKDGEN